MSQSLQDQLVQAGLARPGQAGKRDRKRKPGGGKPATASRRQQGQREADTKPGTTPHAEPAAGKAPKSKRQLKRERIEAVTQVISAHALPRAQGEVPYRYTRGERIKETWVSEGERKALAAGQIALIAQRGRNALIPAERVDEVRAIDPHAVLICVQTGADDEYEYGPPVPDDLIW